MCYANNTLWNVTQTASRSVQTSSVVLLSIDQQALEELLRLTPFENTTSQGYLFNVPLPSGDTVALELVEYSMMEPELADRFPESKTYKAVGADDPSITGRFAYTSKGFSGILNINNETYYFDHPSHTTNTQYKTYARSTYLSASTTSQPFTCSVRHRAQHQEEEPNISRAWGTAKKTISGSKLHTYRLAVAATAEYTEFHGGSVQDGFDAILTAISRINEIYGAELGVQFTLVANNDALIFTDAETDPYSNSDGDAMLDENQSTIDTIIGSANYDIGHVFSTGGGGIALINAPCSEEKALGVTGHYEPKDDAFWVDFVAHELGHQMGAEHSFNGIDGSCSSNRAANSAYEPGSGSSIMAYTNICGTDNIQYYSDDYFHAKSLDEINAFANGGGSTCGIHETQSNQIPNANAGTNYTIPQQTPFALTGAGSDGDNDILAYNWEQYDLGPSTNIGTDTGTGPIFRSFPPSSNPVRTLPSLDTIVYNSAPPTGSTLPTTNRELNFRLTVRDGNGAVASDTSTLTVTTSSGPFIVTSQNSFSTWPGLSTQEITWNVAGTTYTPVSCDSVDILFSDDNGTTFPTTILATTPNDGSELVTAPNLSTSSGRIKIVCSDNIFFDINNASIFITATTIPRVDDFSFSVTAGLSRTSTISAADPDNLILSFTVVTAPQKGTLTITNDNYTYSANAAATGTDSFVIKANNGSDDSANATAAITISSRPTITITPPTDGITYYQISAVKDSSTLIAWNSNETIVATENTSNGLTTDILTSDNIVMQFNGGDSVETYLSASSGIQSCIEITFEGLTQETASITSIDSMKTNVINNTRVQLQRSEGCNLQANVTDANDALTAINQLPTLSGSVSEKLEVTVSHRSNAFTITIDGPIPLEGITF